MHILLTGGTGFFGKALLSHYITCLVSRGLEITVLSRNPNDFLALNPQFQIQHGLKFHKGNILQPDSLPQSTSFTHIIHAATDSTYGPLLSPTERYDQIVAGTRNLLEYAARRRVARFLYVSSGAIYGPQPQDIEGITEDWPMRPSLSDLANTYGIAKLTSEHLCHIYSAMYDFDIVIGRCFAFVGPDLPLSVHFAIGNFIRDCLFGNAVTVNGDGSAVRSYLDQSDLANWLFTILFEGSNGEAYNVGSDQEITIADLACLVRDMLSPSKPVLINSSISTPIDRIRYVPNIAKAREELGLDVCIPLRDSILTAAASHLKSE